MSFNSTKRVSFLQKNFVKNLFSDKCWNRKIHSQVVGIDSDLVVGPDF